MIGKTLALLFCLTLVATGGCASRRERKTIPVGSLKGKGRVFLVPLGGFPTSKAQALAAYYRGKYGLMAGVLPPAPLDLAAFNDGRGQFMSEMVIDGMKRACPVQAEDPEAILIGLTDEDIYIDRYDWQFSFSYREGGRFAVVSGARMRLGALLSEEQIDGRLRKMVTKNIGILHYGLKPNNDPRSVLYNSVGGLRELDRMSEEF